MALAAAILFGSACGGSSDRQYPAEVIGNFLDSCQATGSTRAQCGCAIDFIQQKVSIDEFEREEVRFLLGNASDDFVEIMTDAVLECLR